MKLVAQIKPNNDALIHFRSSEPKSNHFGSVSQLPGQPTVIAPFTFQMAHLHGFTSMRLPWASIAADVRRIPPGPGQAYRFFQLHGMLVNLRCELLGV